MSVTYRAKGPGRLEVYLLHYSDVHDPRTGKYKRNFLPTTGLATVDLTDGEKLYTHECEIPADQWVGLGFHDLKGPVLLDDVTVNLVK